jgi:hypothetical protein
MFILNGLGKVIVIFPKNVVNRNVNFVYKIIYLNYLLHYKKKYLHTFIMGQKFGQKNEES